MNGEVESLVLQVDELQKENEAHKRHTDELNERLAAEKRKGGSAACEVIAVAAFFYERSSVLVPLL